MTETAQVVSKVLVLEDQPAAREAIKTFCEGGNLVGVTTQEENVLAVLRSNIDLSAIFLSSTFTEPSRQGLAFARELHSVRPELPLFLRCSSSEMVAQLKQAGSSAVRAAYTLETIDSLQPVIDESIFRFAYPNVLVRGIAEISRAALESQFVGVQLDVDAPYVVRDRLIFGELFSLIPLESNWCRGYMMLQAEEGGLLGFVQAGKTHASPQADSFRDLNNVLGEVTNLIWGAFKNRYVSYETATGHATQVPIVVNHLHRYISFGSEDPQLCFRYTLRDGADPAARPLVIYQRFVFNLSWSPDKFKENEALEVQLLASGELELF